MADIKFYDVSGPAKELPSGQAAIEKDLQKLFEDNMPAFFGVTFLKSEYRITNGRMDSIGIDENNCPVIFEYKRSLNENVINQGLFYLDWLLDHKADFTLLVMQTLGKEKADAIDWSMPCVICVAHDFTKFDEHAVNQMQRNIKLVRYRKFGDNFIALEYLNAPQVQPIPYDDPQTKPTKKNSRKDRDFQQGFSELSDKNKRLFDSIRDYILSLGDDISEEQLKLYVAFKKAKNFICVEIFQSYILCLLKLNPDTVNLISGFVEDMRGKGHHGTGDLKVVIRNNEDFEKAQPLFARAYHEN